jgi:hypothetical protein
MVWGRIETRKAPDETSVRCSETRATTGRILQKGQLGKRFAFAVSLPRPTSQLA